MQSSPEKKQNNPTYHGTPPQPMMMMDPHDAMIRASGGPPGQSKILHTSAVVGTFLFHFATNFMNTVSNSFVFLVLPDDFDLQEKK